MDIDWLFLGALHGVFQSESASFAHAIRLSWLQNGEKVLALFLIVNALSLCFLASLPSTFVWRMVPFPISVFLWSAMAPYPVFLIDLSSRVQTWFWVWLGRGISSGFITTAFCECADFIGLSCLSDVLRENDCCWRKWSCLLFWTSWVSIFDVKSYEPSLFAVWALFTVTVWAQHLVRFHFVILSEDKGLESMDDYLLAKMSVGRCLSILWLLHTGLKNCQCVDASENKAWWQMGRQLISMSLCSLFHSRFWISGFPRKVTISLEVIFVVFADHWIKSPAWNRS